jgi:phosphate transport system permease protein
MKGRDIDARAVRRRNFIGQVMTSLTGGALAISIVMIVGLFVLITMQGLVHFWPADLVEFTMKDGSHVLGEIHEREQVPGQDQGRLRLKVGNRDFGGLDFRWIDEADVVERRRPKDALVLERLEWGNFHGHILEIRDGDRVIAGADQIADVLPGLMAAKAEERKKVHDFEAGEIGDVNSEIEDTRLERRRIELSGAPKAEQARRQEEVETRDAELEARYAGLADRLAQMRKDLEREHVVLQAVDGQTREIPLSNILRAYRPDAMSTLGKLGLFFSRIGEFVSADPRESNTEGGVFPAIFGTVMMVFVMSLVVVPFGVIAAVYLREYAKEGPLVRLIRIAVNNLAGVPSIVFGVFGLGFFVYVLGGTIDSLFYPERLPTPTFGTGGILWASLTLALLTLPVVIVATEEGLASVPAALREGSRAIGATRLETLVRVTLPAAAPGLLTGVILAMARAAGEVAPLMIVGMVKLAPTLPVDGHFPYVHLERKFMHLGFHIFDVGFQSPNVEAAKPLAFATTLLIVLLVFAMTLAAIIVRERLRSRFRGQTV